MPSNIVPILLVMLFVMLGASFSGAETGMYQLSRLRLRLGIEKKRLPYVVLGRCLHDSSGLLLTLLVGNNMANYLSTNIVTGIILSQVDSELKAEFLATVITVPVLFVFSELIPKNVFLYRADVIMPYLSPPLYVFHKFLNLCGVLPLLKLVSSVFTRLAGPAASSRTVITSAQRHKIQAILKDTHEEGILSPVQNDIINRLITISHIHLKSVMIPINNVELVDFDADDSALLSKLEKSAFTRLPVFRGQPDNIVGFVNIYEALNSSQKFADLSNLVKPIRKIDVGTTVTDAINIIQKENQKIVLVTKSGRLGRERPIGIATMKDLVEELLGELAEW